MYYVYILRSLKDKKFYIGSTSILKDRLKRHFQGRSRATKNRRPLKLVYKEKFKIKREAIKRECYIKSKKSAKYTKRLIREGP